MARLAMGMFQSDKRPDTAYQIPTARPVVSLLAKVARHVKETVNKKQRKKENTTNPTICTVKLSVATLRMPFAIEGK
jgi:hypothetical protein